MAHSSSTADQAAPAASTLSAVPVNDLLSRNADIIARIKLCYGADAESFEREILAVVRRYAAYVHLLPATRGNYFGTPGGLLRLGLEVGFFSLQGTDAHIFSGRSTILARRLLEPRWRQATFIAGLCCELQRVLGQVEVTDSAGAAWPSDTRPLSDWLTGRGSARYSVNWRSAGAEANGLAMSALNQIVSPEVLQHLSEGNTSIVPLMLASIGGMRQPRGTNVMDDLVRRSLALVIDRDLSAKADCRGTPEFGAHLERYLLDAMRRLVTSHSGWVCNQEKSRVWYGQDGLFLLWPGAAEEIRRLLDTEQLAGIPKDPATLLQVLLAAKVLERQDSAQPTWTIYPPSAKTPLEAVKLTSPAALLAGMKPEPTPLDTKLVRLPGTPPEPPPQPARPAPAQALGQAEQLSLISSPAGLPASELGKLREWDQADPAEPVAAKHPALAEAPVSFALKAPMRLNPGVRNALAAVVQSLNEGPGQAQAGIVDDGLFLPTAEFERRGLQPSLALRALAEVSMLVSAQPGCLPTLTRDFHGEPTLGVIIAPRFIVGFEPPAPAPTGPEGH